MPLVITGTTQDVSQRRRADEHRTLLANELSHRVKNTLASLQAIVAQTMRRATSIEDAGSTLEARIQAMAAANDLLISAQFETASLRSLLNRTLAPFGIEDSQRFVISGHDLRLPSHLVVAFALALHELATNATKYGALSSASGRVAITCETEESRHPRFLRLTWIETGGPRVEQPSRTSFGTKLIQRLLARDSAENDNEGEPSKRADERS